MDPTCQRYLVCGAGPTWFQRNFVYRAVNCGDDGNKGVSRCCMLMNPDKAFIYDFYWLEKMNDFLFCRFESKIMTRK